MDLPTITGATAEITATSSLAAGIVPAGLRAAFGVALHMHQPTVLGDGDPTTAPLISNLQRHARAPGGGRQSQRARCSCAAMVASPISLAGSSARGPAPAADARLLRQPALGPGADGPDGRARGAPAHDRARAGAVDRVARHHVVARRRVVDAGPRSRAAHAGLASSLRRAVRAARRSRGCVGSRRPRWACPFTPTSASPTCARCAGADTGG